MPLFLFLFLMLFGLLALDAPAKQEQFPRQHALIQAEELMDLIQSKQENVVLFSVANLFDYRMGHIPGAHRVWRSDYSIESTTGEAFEGMVVPPEEFETLVRKYGVNNDSIVVVYDYKYDATRLWWTFFLYGKTDVQVLDGGMKAWRAKGYETDFFAPDLPEKKGDFTVEKVPHGWAAGIDEVLGAKTSLTTQLWDTREVAEWDGTKQKRGAARAGRISWAKFAHWSAVLQAKTGKFLSPSAMRRRLRDLGFEEDKKQIFYCQTGVRTTQIIFALYLLGWPAEHLSNYDGSWVEWSHRNDN